MRTKDRVEAYLRQAIRVKLNHKSGPVYWDENPSSPPKQSGTYGHYETMGGQIVHHPSAYARVGWSNLRYISTTIQLTVGQQWFVRRLRLRKGYHWSVDKLGVKIVRTRTGQDFHPSLNDMIEGGLENKLIALSKARKEKLKADKQRNRLVQAGLIRVTLEDSQRAGNCPQGSKRWAEQRNLLNCEKSVNARRLLPYIEDPRVERAINAAFVRATLVTI